jgi:hypothetical protein
MVTVSRNSCLLLCIEHVSWVRLFSTGLVGNGSDHLTTRRFGFGCGIGSGTTPSA